MKPKSALTTVNINNLILDINNPRFAELYSGSEKEEDLIQYLLFNESAREVAKGILEANEFYPDRPLWVVKDGDNYIVKDGNRRCSAVKALKSPRIHGLDLPKFEILELPVLVYDNIEDLNVRIIQEHTNSLFRRWDRIAQALEVYKLYTSGNNTLESLKEIDSQPIQLIKLASFYYEAVKICGEDLKKLLRRGKGETGGKTIIFERLFRDKIKCGYNFLSKPSYRIEITDRIKFESYITSIVKYLQLYPKTKTDTIDLDTDFISKLIPYGFLHKHSAYKKSEFSLFNEVTNLDMQPVSTDVLSLPTDVLSLPTDVLSLPTDVLSLPTDVLSLPTDVLPLPTDVLPLPTDVLPLPTDVLPLPTDVLPLPTDVLPLPTDVLPLPTGVLPLPTDINIFSEDVNPIYNTNTLDIKSTDTRKSIKNKPSYKRKKIPASLEKLIQECYNLDSSLYPNSKTALSRVTFECTLKFIVENTQYNSTKNIADSQYFRNVFYDGSGAKRQFTDFTKLKNLFCQLITNTGDRKAFEVFDLELPHQIIHNYKVGAIPASADSICDNLITLIEFMLKDESELLTLIDITKLT